MYNVSLCLGRLGCVPPSPALLANWWDDGAQNAWKSPKSRGHHCTDCALSYKEGLRPCSRSNARQEAFVLALVDALGVAERGFFVEMGGHNGLHASNTVFAESCRRWMGLLVEPNPRSFEQLTANRGAALAARAAACTTATMVPFVSRRMGQKRAGARADEMGGIEASMDVVAQKSRLSKITAGKQGGDDAPAPWIEAPEHFDRYLVPCVPLRELFDRLAITRVDVFWLDIEGAELDALRSVDFSRVSIGVLVVEMRVNSAERNRAIRELLRAAGFELVAALSVWAGHVYDNVFLRVGHFSPRGLGAASALLQTTPAATIFMDARAARRKEATPIYANYTPGRYGRRYALGGLASDSCVAPNFALGRHPEARPFC